MQTQESQAVLRHRHLDGLPGLTSLDGEPELAVQHAGCGVDVGVGVYPRRHPHQDVLRHASGGRDFAQQGQLVEVVHNDATDAVVQGHLQLFPALVVAVKVDIVRRKLNPSGHRKLASRYDVKPQSLLLQQLGQRNVDEGFAGVDHRAAGVARLELCHEGAAGVPQGGLVEDVEGRTELLGQPDDVAASKHKVAL